jgi:bifunctional non-homologous end joining protein LigD
MSLDAYRRKRRFAVTPEPEGNTRPAHGRELLYVVQKHQASHLHYDLRLEWNGVLLSWAVPKGPSLDPSVKRLAMRVEDHPVDYARFEGSIPHGEYGAGTVMVWDIGTWVPEAPDVDAALRRGELKFTLRGRKLKGSWVLVRTRGLSGRAAWLLIKHRDAAASARDVETQRARSVLSNRTLASIARASGGDVDRAAAADPPSRRARPDGRARSGPRREAAPRKSTR